MNFYFNENPTADKPPIQFKSLINKNNASIALEMSEDRSFSFVNQFGLELNEVSMSGMSIQIVEDSDI
ncbi:hypothetical protein SS50377_28623 [Spironucleus salmonicida]|uniref:Uncharacterized protein n=1 Tax=Spironucleus salmonicida TaxID=348837 RepID=V6LBD2_9EUKA|nr:hypothetical protein SS50377_28623 [Spironucleus salmonicida]|eukprot:EST41558.1 Hypothetical protein SS50377_18898 [Spironucleus salmonicida]